MPQKNRHGNTLIIGADHGGADLKELIRKHLEAKNIKVIDLGAAPGEVSDYPDNAKAVAEAVLTGRAGAAILICGTGIGISIAANRYQGIRAALCHDEFTARMSRAHNNANILALGGRILGPELAKAIVDVWLATPFEGGRHENRIKKIDEI